MAKDPNGSRSRGKKNKKAQERWDKVARAIFELNVLADEGMDGADWENAEDDDKAHAYALADTVISLVDNLIA